MKVQRQQMVFLVALMAYWSGVFGAAPTSTPAATNEQPAKLITPDEVIIPGGKILPYTVDGKWKVFNLAAEPVSQVIYSDNIDELSQYVPQMDRYKGLEMGLPLKKQTLNGWGYNGSIPGPAIVVRKGDAVRIIVENKLPEATSIHWHGIILPNKEDGTGSTTEPVLEPGKKRTYEFEIHQEGTFMYHSGFNDTKQVRKGLAGFFIALPEKQEGNQESVKDFAIMLQEFTFQKGAEEPVIFSMDPNWFTFNGLSSPNIPALVVKQGDAVRIRYGNLGELSHPIHLHGYSFNVTGTEGGPIQKSAQWPAATVEISPGQTRDIQLTAANPGVWRLHCHKLLHIMSDNSYWTHLQIVKTLGVLPVGGMFSFLVVKQNRNDNSPYWDTLP